MSEKTPKPIPSKRVKDSVESLFNPASQAERREHLEHRGKALLEHGIKSLQVLQEVGDKRIKPGHKYDWEGATDAVEGQGWFDIRDGLKVRVRRAVFSTGEDGAFDFDEQTTAGKTTKLELDISKFDRWGQDILNGRPGEELPDSRNSLSISIWQTDKGTHISGMNMQQGLGTKFDHRESPHYDEFNNGMNLSYVESHVDLAEEAVLAIQGAALESAQANPA